MPRPAGPEGGSRYPATDLAEEERSFRALVDDLPQTVFELDPEGRFTFVNPFGLRFTGFTGADVQKGLTFLDIVAPEDRRRLKENFEKRMRGESFEDHEYVFVKKDGSRYPVSVYSSVIERKGRVLGARGIAVDLSVQKRAERRIRDSERRFRILFEGAPDPFFVYDAQGNILDANRAAERITGSRKDELVGRNILRPGTFPGSDLHDVAALLSRNVRGEATGPDQFAFQKQDGETVELEVHTVPVELREGIEFLGIARDVSERNRALRALEASRRTLEERVRERTSDLQRAKEALEKSEKYYRGLFENAHDAILIFRPGDEVVLDVNRSACRMYGYSREAFLGLSLKSLSQDVSSGEDHIRRTLKTGGVHAFETVQRRRDGTEMRLEVNASVVDYQGTKAILSINRDVTEQRLQRQALEESEARFRAVVQQAMDCVYIADIGTKRIIDSNRALQALLGYSADEMKALLVYDFIGHETEDIDGKIAEMVEAGSGLLPRRMYRKRDGSTVPMEIAVSVITWRGRQAFCVVARDLSHRV